MELHRTMQNSLSLWEKFRTLGKISRSPKNFGERKPTAALCSAPSMMLIHLRKEIFKKWLVHLLGLGLGCLLQRQKRVPLPPQVRQKSF